jgi:signal transduction histidine kinase
VSALVPDTVRDALDLATLTGVRSGKRSYYREFQRSNERLHKTVRAMDSIALALVRPVEGPRALIEQVLTVAAEHLQADWMLLALADDALVDSRPRFLALDERGRWYDGIRALPPELRRELRTLRGTGSCEPAVSDDGWVRVTMTLDGVPVGGLVGRHGLGDSPDDADLAVLRILANQAAVSMHTTDLHQSGLVLQRRAQQLYDEVSQQAKDLTVRNDELRAAEQRLRAADQRELLDGERHRIALELHDSVAQSVLSAGLVVDVCRAESAGRPEAADLATQLAGATALIGKATEQLRSVIYALHHARSQDDVASLPDLLQEMANQHQPHLAVAVRLEGRPTPLGTATEHSLARTAGEALFNVSMHAQATRALVRLRYSLDGVSLFVSDDGTGDPRELRRMLRLSAAGATDGRHRGLANMAARATELGGSLSIRRSRLGGVRISVQIPSAPRATGSNS